MQELQSAAKYHELVAEVFSLAEVYGKIGGLAPHEKNIEYRQFDDYLK